jgi:pilus assembly protein CpaC
VRSIDRGIVLEGSVESPSIANDVQLVATGYIDSQKEFIVNRLSVNQPTQVNLRVRVAEVKRSSLKKLGFNWDAAFATGGFLLGIATGNPVLAAGNLFGADSLLTRNDDSNSLFGSYVGKNFDVNNVLDALADEGLLSVMAEPNLTAVSGEKASFLAGGEFPIPVSQDNGVTTIEFKQFGVYLAFTPVVLDSGRVSLRVAPEVSELSSEGSVTVQGFNIPGLTVRKAVTTVELGSGQSFGIAGLISNNVTHALSKFPGLGEVPVIGTLFRSDEFQRNETELVIVVTPYLVRPAPNAKMALPTDGLEPPNDEDRILRGRNYGDQTGAASAPGLASARRKDDEHGTGFILN